MTSRSEGRSSRSKNRSMLRPQAVAEGRSKSRSTMLRPATPATATWLWGVVPSPTPPTPVGKSFSYRAPAHVRLVLHGVILGMLLFQVITVARADELVSLEAYEAAATHDLNPAEVQGASNSVGTDPWSYVRWLFSPPPPPPVTPYGVWDRLAACESNGRWHIDAYHDGGLQFHPGTWDAYKPRGYPAYAYQASREQQIAVGIRVQAAQGWNAWPTCRRILGLPR